MAYNNLSTQENNNDLAQNGQSFCAGDFTLNNTLVAKATRDVSVIWHVFSTIMTGKRDYEKSLKTYLIKAFVYPVLQL